MADDPHNTSGISDRSGPDSPREDAATKATRKELKQTMISEKSASVASTASEPGNGSRSPAARGQDAPGAAQEPARAKTPEQDSSNANEALREQVSSPKKKRAHDELDELDHKDSLELTPAGGLSQTNPTTSAYVRRTDRSEPEKKRPRDEQVEVEDSTKSEAADQHVVPVVDPSQDSKEVPASKDVTGAASARPDSQEDSTANAKSKADKPTTSAAAFAASGFSKLSGSASPFGSLGAGLTSAGGFGGSSSNSPSPFGALGAAASGPKLGAPPTLGFGKDEKLGSASPFASLNGGASKTFGSGFSGGGFGGGFGGPKLASFAKPGEALVSDKPARPFGAPESDNEESSEGGDGDEEDSGPEDPESDEKETEDPKPTAVAVDDKKKIKLQKVTVDDGETGEVTIFNARAKVYQLDKASSSWKEKGAGSLKVNVPEASIEYNSHNAPIPETFDASVLGTVPDTDVKTPRVARLLMRQDHTHRVVLNTAIVAATDFIERETLKSAAFIFSSLEGPEAKPVTLQLKMSQANAKQFSSITGLILKELRSLG